MSYHQNPVPEDYIIQHPVTTTYSEQYPDNGNIEMTPLYKNALFRHLTGSLVHYKNYPIENMPLEIGTYINSNIEDIDSPLIVNANAYRQMIDELRTYPRDNNGSYILEETSNTYNYCGGYYTTATVHP